MTRIQLFRSWIFSAILCLLALPTVASAGFVITQFELQPAMEPLILPVSSPLNTTYRHEGTWGYVETSYDMEWDETAGTGEFVCDFQQAIDGLGFIDHYTTIRIRIETDAPHILRASRFVDMAHDPADIARVITWFGVQEGPVYLISSEYSEGRDLGGASAGSYEFADEILLGANSTFTFDYRVECHSPTTYPGFMNVDSQIRFSIRPISEGGNTCHDDGFSDATSLEAIPLPIAPLATSNTLNFYGDICVFGDTIIAGNVLDTSAGVSSGAAHIFRHNGGRWYEDRTLLPSDAQAGDMIGDAVAIADDTAIVGAPRDDDDGEDSGSVYVFERSNDLWPESAKLRPADGAAENAFGTSIAMEGDIAVIGATKGDGAVTDSGAAYVFRRIAGVWQEEAKLTASDAATNDRFGLSVSISGDTIIVGATGNGSRGAAYVFRYDAGAWHQEARLAHPFGEDGDSFGIGVSIDGELAVIGAPGSMSAHVFRRTGITWAHETNLSPSAYTPRDFGHGVSISGNIIVVSDPMAPGTPGVNFSGAASVYLHDGDDWLEAATLRAVEVHSPLFGVSLSIDGGSIVCGGLDQALVGPRIFELTTSGDCNQNLVPDECDLDFGDPDNDGLVSTDCNGDGIPDECRTPGDTNGDGLIDLGDVPGFVAEALGQVDCRFGDFNADDMTDGHDVGLFAGVLLGS